MYTTYSIFLTYIKRKSLHFSVKAFSMVAGTKSIDNQFQEIVGSKDTKNESKKIVQGGNTVEEKTTLMIENFVRLENDLIAVQNFFDFLCRIGKITAKDYE